MAVIKKPLEERLRDQWKHIDQICRDCGSGAVSVAVVHQGKAVFTQSTGHDRVVEKGLPDDRTLYTLCSISKSFLVAAVGILVDRGKCRWSDPVGLHCPEFDPKGDPRVATKATFNDFFRHSGGLANPVVSIFGPEGKVLVSEKDFIHVLNDTPTGNQHFGPYHNATWKYSNVAYGLLALIVQRLTGKRYADFISEEILEPLEMHDTAVYKHQVSSSKNVARSYVRLSDGSWCKQPEHEWTDEDNTPILAIVGIRSSVRDLTTWCAAMLDAQWGDPARPSDVIPNRARNPLRQVNAILNGHYWTRPTRDDIQNLSNFYLSWFKCVIPSSMVHWGSWNNTLADNGDEPEAYINDNILGRCSREKSMYKMTGIGYCGTGSVNLFPDSMSAVVVLSSGLNAGDPSDFAAAVMIQELFDLQPRVDIMRMVLHERQSRLRDWSNVIAEWKKNRDPQASIHPLEEYVGQYRGLGITLDIHKNGSDCGLRVIFNGRIDTTQILTYYKEDMYSYMPLTRDDWLKGAWLDWDYYLVGILHFQRNASGRVFGLTWIWGKGCDPALFAKITASIRWRGYSIWSHSSVEIVPHRLHTGLLKYSMANSINGYSSILDKLWRHCRFLPR